MLPRSGQVDGRSDGISASRAGSGTGTAETVHHGGYASRRVTARSRGRTYVISSSTQMRKEGQDDDDRQRGRGFTTLAVQYFLAPCLGSSVHNRCLPGRVLQRGWHSGDMPRGVVGRWSSEKVGGGAPS